MSTAARIRRAAREAGYPTQRALAAAAGITPNALAEITNGHRPPALRTARRLARALGVTVHHLYHGDASGVRAEGAGGEGR